MEPAPGTHLAIVTEAKVASAPEAGHTMRHTFAHEAT